jgi:hypothetical protein
MTIQELASRLVREINKLLNDGSRQRSLNKLSRDLSIRGQLKKRCLVVWLRNPH